MAFNAIPDSRLTSLSRFVLRKRMTDSDIIPMLPLHLFGFRHELAQVLARARGGARLARVDRLAIASLHSGFETSAPDI